MIERVRNVIKADYRKTKCAVTSDVSSEPKRRKKGVELLRRYPISVDGHSDSNENAESCEQHNRAIAAELAKAKPWDSVLLPLVKSTYSERRMFVLNDAVSVKDILEKYQAMSRPAIVSFD